VQKAGFGIQVVVASTQPLRTETISTYIYVCVDVYTSTITPNPTQALTAAPATALPGKDNS
jgi:ABC-type molybdate transport system permease subunit